MKLRNLDPAGNFTRSDPSVPFDEVGRVANLRVQGACDGGLVELFRVSMHNPVVENGLDDGASDVLVRAVGAEQDTGHRRSPFAVLVLAQDLQLLKLNFVSDGTARAEESVREQRVEAIGSGSRYEPEVGTEQARVATELEQPLQGR